MKGMDKYIQKIPGGIRIQELQKIPAPWNVPHLKKGTIHQVDFNLVQAQGWAWLFNCGASVASEQQHNQDFKRKYSGTSI